MSRALAVSVAVLLGCRSQSAKPPGSSTQAQVDTVRGVLVVEGSDPYPVAALQTSAGRIVVEGASAGMLKLTHLDLWVRGTQTSAGRFQVNDYRVRGANGVRAWSGVLRTGPTGFRLELDNRSSHDVRGAPANFDRLTGARLWLTENPDGTLREYGVY
ncbi:MAG: hypothetical protein ACJ8AJ_02925 [Gemmatimonadaceae bacterium]